MLNWDLLSHPWNWAVVAFSLILLITVMHLFYRNNSMEGN